MDVEMVEEREDKMDTDVIMDEPMDIDEDMDFGQ